ncbi:FGGY-family carbohydrate kinase [Paracoccus albus]|uniref:FGGY-family carbohydrate kinase n=1 Tax=Paracoccus albus TaxID=3017784 RepID=UPI0022F11830|nr:FGGY-family carbohydrate kinase [Paracoccus albus]WBU60900.1 FGGY-family carbohydrate kinase [Paracoccus albus]
MSDYVIGIDIGTTSTIGILIELPDRVLAQASRPATLSSPRQGWAEEDPEEWWQNTCQIIPELLDTAGVAASDVRGIGVAGMLPAVILLDEAGVVLRPSIQQSDGRSGAEVAEVAAEVDAAEFLARAGNGINQQLLATKLRWIEKNEPGVFARIATVMGSYDYINFRLTGEKAVEQNWALEAGFVNLSTNELDGDLIAIAHIPCDAIPVKRASHEVMGHVSEAAAQATGLPAGIPVIGGAADHIASGYAAGVTQPGDVLLKFGGAADILVASKTPQPDARMFLDYHLVPGMFMPNGCMASGGSALNWFAAKLAQGEAAAADAAGISLHQHLDKIAGETPAGADGVQIIPYFLGEKTPIHDAQARGVIHGLSLNHDLRHIWRALLEGFAYAFRHHVEVFREMGHPSTRFLASDGGSKSRFWMQICADVLQQPVQLLHGHPGSCLGAAYMAAVGAGLTDNFAGVAKFISQGETIDPDQANAAVYDDGYRRFRSTYDAMVAARERSV